jgi:hypothetical protein
MAKAKLTSITGMAHEHQRSNRNTYVRYDCTKLAEYSNTIARARVDDPSLTSTEFCTDIQLVKKYSFSGQSYMQTYSWKGHNGYTANEETPYDVDSIMHYDSYNMGGEKC